MKCPSCHEGLTDDAQFCGSCGLPTGPARAHASTQIDVPHTTSPQAEQPDTRNSSSPADTNEQYASEPDPRIGLVLDAKYKLIERLGDGGMGAVFRAQRLHIGDEVAVKLLHPDMVREKNALERFRREARSAAMIRHPNVVSIHDFSDGRGNNGASEAYIVMELVRGLSLANLLRREGRMSPPRAIALMQDICAGVGVAHRQGLLHRDLKPDNVIVTPPTHDGDRETAKVVDFGLAKVRDAGAASGLTHTGAVLGTLYYMSPEQCRGEELDARSDVYSLGAMLYEMLTGAPPFRSSNVTGLIAKHLQEPPPPFPTSLEIPPALASACFRALAKDKRERQPDAIAFARELSAPPSPPRIETKATGSSAKWFLLAAAAVIVLVGAIGLAIAVKFGIDRWQANSSINQNVAPPISSPSVAESNVVAVDLKGTWSGTYGPLGYATKLIIQNQNGNKLDGILEQGTIRVAFNGTYDPQSRSVRLKQTEVLRGEGWILGEDVGKLSADGKQLSGTGKDEVGGMIGISYQWSFRRP